MMDLCDSDRRPIIICHIGQLWENVWYNTSVFNFLKILIIIFLFLNYQFSVLFLLLSHISHLLFFFPRLHGHAIFGVVLVSDTCWTPVRVRLAWFRCPASVSFFFFFCFSDTALTRLRMAPTRLRHASNGKKKKKNHKCLTSHLCPLPLPSVARRS